MKLKYMLGIGAATLMALTGGTYWYVFVAGAPQLDGPGAQSEDSTLTYEVVTYTSKIFGTTRTYGISLPPGYKKHPHQHYPVIFLLHGGHGEPTDWFKKAAALPIIQKLYATHRLPASIIIAADGNDNRGSSPFWDPEYIDGPNGKVLSAIGDELVQVVESRYRTKPRPYFWAIGGLSSGGWGALNVGLHYPQNFAVMFSHSGYFVDNSGADNSPLYYISELQPDQRKHLSIYLDAGEGDGKYLDQSQQFHEQLDRLKIQNEFNAFPGGHGLTGADVGWNYWHTHLADSLSYVGDRFANADLIHIAKSSPNLITKHKHPGSPPRASRPSQIGVAESQEMIIRQDRGL